MKMPTERDDRQALIRQAMNRWRDQGRLEGLGKGGSQDLDIREAKANWKEYLSHEKL